MDEERSATRLKELLDYASRFWAGEAEVARAFFSRPRSTDEHVRWLRLQAYKELQPRDDGIILRLVDTIKEQYPKLEHGLSRVDYLHTIQFLEEEFRHYVLFANVLDELTGGQITPEELAKYEYPEERKLRLLRRRYMEEHGDLARFASSFCEGGGASIFHEGMQIGGDPLSDQIAEACKGIYEDEVGHAAHGIHGLGLAAKTEEDWALAWRMVEAISKQRLLMRNEQFGSMLSDGRVREIAEGKIELPARFAAMLA